MMRTLLLAVLCLSSAGCSRTTAHLTISDDEGRVSYADVREAHFANEGGHTYFLVEPGRSGNVLYEPYPLYRTFTKIAGVLSNGEATAGTMTLITGDLKESMGILSSHREGAGKSMTITVVGQTGPETVSIQIQGSPTKNTEYLKKHVRELLADGSP